MHFGLPSFIYLFIFWFWFWFLFVYVFVFLQGLQVCLVLLCPGVWVCVYTRTREWGWGRWGMAVTPVPGVLGSGPSLACKRPPLALAAGFPQDPPQGGACCLRYQCFRSRKLGLWATNRSAALGIRARRGSASGGVQGHLVLGWHPGCHLTRERRDRVD